MKDLQLWSETQHTLFCREISFVASYTRDEGGGSQKVTNDDEGEGGVTIPPKIDDVIYEQPLTRFTCYLVEEDLVQQMAKLQCCQDLRGAIKHKPAGALLQHLLMIRLLQHLLMIRSTKPSCSPISPHSYMSKSKR